MKVRALDSQGDWTFGSGLSNYKSARDAIAQNIQTRLSSFLNDCFFDTGAGIDWWNLLGGKNQLALNLVVNAVILNTDGVTGILQTSLSVTESRLVSLAYNVQTLYSQLSGTFQYDTGGLG